MTGPSVPLVDLHIQHDRIADEVRSGFDRVLENTAFVLGPAVEEFERAYATFCGVAHCRGLGNGTDAVEVALRSCDIGAGDEVIVPANTFVATVEAVVRAGATPVLVDCAEDFLIDPERIAAARSARTRAVLPVHLYGQMAPMAAVADAAGPDVVVIEDAAQSQGARQAGSRSGSVGRVAATSFYPGKNLGAYGDAGAVTTDDEGIADRVARLRNHGGSRRYEHREMGFNSRMDGLQGVVLTAKLAHLDAWNAERSVAAGHYQELLANREDVVLPSVVAGNEHVWHLYVVRVPRRDDVVAALNAAGIGAGIHYPQPVHRLPAFPGLGGPGAFPVAERLAAEILSLPIYPGIAREQQERVVDELVKALG